ncbi:protein AF-9 isoform X2 [Protopterus annectens]|uniref:protein AF-9 isoform X2 n=1 Tax=Protopterus annectens TaxID=7888 RepID=UPI001CFA15DA|nr:protein AF-9 isoform X2 [Protopterus annectens]
MASSCAVQVKLELGHRAQVRKKPTVEGFTHDWMVFVRGPEHTNIQHFVEKVVFHLHESFPRPKRVCKDPPYKVEESGYAGFILPIEVYFKNKEEPKKVRFDYDLFLHLEGHPPVNHLRCEKLTFNNPTEEFRRKLLKAGGELIISGTSTNSNSCLKPHKTMKEHKDKPVKDSKEHKSAFKEPSREHIKPSKEASKKPKETKPLKEEKIIPKMAFKEPKPMSKEPKLETSSVFSGVGIHPDMKIPSKRPSISDSDELAVKKRKKSNSDLSLVKGISSVQPTSCDKKLVKDKDKLQPKPVKAQMDSEVLDRRRPTLPPFEDVVDPNDSDVDDMSSKCESGQPSPASSTSSSSSSFAPVHIRPGPLRPVRELHSDDNEDESDGDDNSKDSEVERPLNTHGGSRGRRVSLSDGSDSESSSSSSSPPRNEPPPLLKTSNNQILEVRSPIKQNKQEKQVKNGDGDKIVNLIEETGHFHITNTTFDFDLCSLDKTTVRKLQSYLETSEKS